MFHRILVGVDDTEAAQAALRRALELVDAGHGRLGLLCAAPGPPTIGAAGPVIMPVSRAQLERELVDWAQANVDAAARAVPQEIPVTKLVARGCPARALLRAAREGDWDLIVVGRSQRVSLLGRIGDRLVRRSPTPVLVVRDTPAPPPRARRRWRRDRRAAVKPA
jgi:nucleotide-binding universal stress UspA family protein